MQTIPFLPHCRFDPEVVQNMSVAYTGLCQTLGLGAKLRDAANEIVAHKVMEIAERGARTHTIMFLLAMEEFKDGR